MMTVMKMSRKKEVPTVVVKEICELNSFLFVSKDEQEE